MLDAGDTQPDSQREAEADRDEHDVFIRDHGGKPTPTDGPDQGHTQEGHDPRTNGVPEPGVVGHKQRQNGETRERPTAWASPNITAGHPNDVEKAKMGVGGLVSTGQQRKVRSGAEEEVADPRGEKNHRAERSQRKAAKKHLGVHRCSGNDRTRRPTENDHDDERGQCGRQGNHERQGYTEKGRFRYNAGTVRFRGCGPRSQEAVQ